MSESTREHHSSCGPTHGFPTKRHFIREGEVDDYMGRFVVDLIASEEADGRRFVVYLDEDLGIQWWVRDKSGDCLMHDTFADNFGTIMNNVVHLETLSASLQRKKTTPETQTWVREKIAVAMQEAGERERAEREQRQHDGRPESREAVHAETAHTPPPPERDVPPPPGSVQAATPEVGSRLHELRWTNQVLRSTRRLIAEALARAYVPQLGRPVEEERLAIRQAKVDAGLAKDAADHAEKDWKDKFAANAAAAELEALRAKADLLAEKAKIAKDKADDLMALQTKSETDRATARAGAGLAADNCLQLAKDYLRARSSDRGRGLMIWGALIALGIALALWLTGFALHQTSREVELAAVNKDIYAAQGWTVNAAMGSKRDIPATLKYIKDLEDERSEILTHGRSAWLTNDGMNIISSSALGALGAMLSLLMAASKRDYDSGAGQRIHMLEGGTRIVVGILGATFITLGLKSEFFMGFLDKETTSGPEKIFYLQMLLGFAAGLSERLVPSFISIVEAQVQTKP